MALEIKLVRPLVILSQLLVGKTRVTFKAIEN